MELVYPPVIALAKGVFRALDIRLIVTGGEHVPRTGGAVMAINHLGYLDFTFAGMAAQAAGRLVRFMAKKSVFDHRISGPLMRGMKHIPVDRVNGGAASYREALNYLKRGEIVGVFPEATISESYELKDFKSGAARMAMATGIPLLPCVIWGSQRIFTKGRPKDFTRGTPVRIAVGPPLHVSRSDNAVQVTEELKRRMQVLLDEARASYPGGPRSPQDTWWIPASLGGTAPTLQQAARIPVAREPAGGKSAGEVQPVEGPGDSPG